MQCVSMQIQITLKWIRINRSSHWSRVVVGIPYVEIVRQELVTIPYVTSSSLMIYQRKFVVI